MPTSQIIESIEDLVLLPKINHDLFGDLCWWRGQADKDWELCPRIYREPYNSKQRYERDSLRWFKSRARVRHNEMPKVDSFFEWLSLAQHYRLPTRLLDWSESILVALFFAVRENLDSDAALWCLNAALMNKEC